MAGDGKGQRWSLKGLLHGEAGACLAGGHGEGSPALSQAGGAHHQHSQIILT